MSGSIDSAGKASRRAWQAPHGGRAAAGGCPWWDRSKGRAKTACGAAGLTNLNGSRLSVS